MLRPVTIISFLQQAPRSKRLTYEFVNEFECSDSWRDLTNKATITLPKNVYVRDGSGNLVSLAGTNVNIGGFSTSAPLFIRGDAVTIDAGYRYFDNSGRERLSTSRMLTGYISNVTSKKPIVLECEDNMYKLKQLPAVNKVFPGSKYTLESMLKELLTGTGFTVNALTNTSLGDFTTQNETVCEVLARLRKDYHFESYFRGNELRTGSLVYIESDAIKSGVKRFAFQKNIIDSELDYKRRDDIRLSAIAYSINKVELDGGITKKGKRKTRHERLQVLIAQQGTKFVRKVKLPGEKAEFAPNTVGERRTLYFWNVTDPVKLGDMAEAELKKYFYTGLRGTFTTFGMPFVQMGDNADILDPVLPERNGRYKVKSVKYRGGIHGLRQIVELDYLITRLDAQGNAIV